MHIVRGGHFWQLCSITSLATESTGGVILVQHFGPNVASEAISERLILIFLGEHAPRPP